MRKTLLCFLLFGIGISFFFSGCASRLVDIPTRVYAYEGQDSFVVANHSINIDSMRILFVNLANDSTVISLDSLYDTMLEKKNSGVIMNNIRAASSGMEMTTEAGILRNQFLSLSYLKTIQKLQRFTDVFSIQEGSKRISQNRIDTIIRELNIDVLMVMDMVTYDVKKEMTNTNYLLNDYVLSYANLSQPPSSSETSRHVYIHYRADWRFLWLDKSTKKVCKIQKIALGGQHQSAIHGGEGVMEGLFSCALKVSDDFADIFK